MKYTSLYRRFISSYRTGFKLAPGPTGIGKTSSLEEVIHVPECGDRKSIYFAPRKQLVEDVGKMPSCLILHRDLDVVFFTLRDFHPEFYELFEDELFWQYVHRWNELNPNRRIDAVAVKRACQQFEAVLAEHKTVPSTLEFVMDEWARLILGAFRAALLGANNRKGNSPSYQKLADHPAVQSLFPFIAFKRRPEIRLIAMTIQKAFYGFFDGRRTLDLTTLEGENGGYILYLDEFDFLEHELVQHICRAAEIEKPFQVVALFYRAMTFHKLPKLDYPHPLPKNIRARIESINALINGLRNRDQLYPLKFPDINQFTRPLRQRPGGQTSATRTAPAIFRTNHTISTNYLYIRETNRSFEILTEAEENPETFSALGFFDTISSACQQIIWLFRALRLGDDEVIYRELLRQCFQDTTYMQDITLISQLAFMRDANSIFHTELDALLEQGYSLYDVHDLEQITDREEVEVRHYGIYLTPESILSRLIQNNLVFGLSATADIPRYVHHFHLDWLQEQDETVDIMLDKEDQQLLRDLNDKKAQLRRNQMQLHVLDTLDSNNEDQRTLAAFINAVAKDEDFGNDTQDKHLQSRVHLFFASLLWMREKPLQEKQETSLLFLTTFRQIRLIFDRYPTPDHRLFTVTKRGETPWFQVYDLLFLGQAFVVVFYNAKMGNTMRQNQPAQDMFDRLFWEGIPVVVVTQYQSAANGINLQYWTSPEKECQQDFLHVGLLESPYFYFGKLEEELTWNEKIALLKGNIWYQAKLYAGKVISEQRFHQVLETLSDPWEWNKHYQTDRHTSADALLNNIATYIQALGRVERVWNRVPDQTALLSREVYNQFQRFCGPDFDQLRQEREPTLSGNTRQLFAHVERELPLIHRKLRRAKDPLLAAKNDLCQQAIQQHLKRLAEFRQGSGDISAREEWQHLRQAALMHHFEDPLLLHYDCVADSVSYQDGVVYLTPQKEIIPSHLANYGTYQWVMDKVYNVVRNNQVIHDYFVAQQYPLAFSRSIQQFFTPYCYQAILTGAIGEEATIALLLEEEISLEPVPDPLFEVADHKLAASPFYIDSKFYNEQTINRFALADDDPMRHPELNEAHFAERARSKVELLRAYHGTEVKLIYLNLVSSHSRKLLYYDASFGPVEAFLDASIIVVPGVLQRRAPNTYHQAFEQLLRDLRGSIQI